MTNGRQILRLSKQAIDQSTRKRTRELAPTHGLRAPEDALAFELVGEVKFFRADGTEVTDIDHVLVSWDS